MKFKVEEKPFLENGRHTVKITKVEEGSSENKGVPFFSCRFENEEGFINHRFYQSEPSMPLIAALLKATGIEHPEGKTIDTKQFIDKELSINVGERQYEDPNTGKMKTIKEASDFHKAGEAETSSK